MKRVLDVDVAFLLRGRVLASSAQLPILGQLPIIVDQHAEEMATNGRSLPVAIDQGDEGYLVVVAPFAGEAEDHKAAYALVVPRRPAVTFSYLASQLLATDPKTLPWMQLAPIGGSPPREALLQSAVLVCLVVTVGSFFAVQPLIDLAKHASSSLPF